MPRILRGAPAQPEIAPTKRFYIMVLMAAVTALAMTDRNILSILLVPIKQELKVSDTAMGLLTGTAFAVVYATTAIPLARVADVGNRRTLLVVCLAVWSGATALSGFATSYLQLLVARIGVAGGEAPANPAITSMIADLYPPERRATALGAILIGLGLGVMFGSVCGGLLAQELGWRAAFFAVGVPGILLAILIWLTVPEPLRGGTNGLHEDPDSRSIWLALRYMMTVPSFLHILSAKTFMQISSQASLIWAPAFLIRVHGLSLAETGLYYGVAIALATFFAAVIGGPISDRLARKGPAGHLRFCIVSMVLSGPTAVGLALAPSAAWAVAFIFLYGFVSALNNTASMAGALAVVRPQMRGVMTAVVNFVYSLLGAGLGGLIVGLLNDVLEPRYGDQAIRYSLLIMPVASTIAAVSYYLGSRTLDRDAKRAESPVYAPPST